MNGLWDAQVKARVNTDGRMDKPKPICPLNFYEVGGIKNMDPLSFHSPYTSS